MKTCIVTGAASGTGYAVAARFAQAGYAVCVTSRQAEKAAAAALALQNAYAVPAWGFALDPENFADIEKMYAALDAARAEIGAVVLVAADLGMAQDALTTPLSAWKRVMDTNVVWNYEIARQAALRMKETGGGGIVFVGSNTAARAIPNRSAYIASKGALQALSRALAVDLGKFGVRSNVLVSGNIKNDRFQALDAQTQALRCRRAPIGDIAAYEDIAQAAYFLGSELSRVTTGAELTLDGGVLAQLTPPGQ